MLPDWPAHFFDSARAFLSASDGYSPPPATPIVASVLSPRSSLSRSSRSGDGKKSKQSAKPDLFEWICAECVHGKNEVVEQQYLSSRRDAATSSDFLSDSQEAGALDIAALAEVSWVHEFLDRQVLVWWQDDGCCYRGTVSAYDPLSRRHRVSYDDGEWEFIDLATESVLYILNGAENMDANTSQSCMKNKSSSSNQSPTVDLAPPHKRTKRF